jgi:glycosyltransferase involved in cell wall biosynthesis
VDDFAAARNASFEACTGDWVIWLDADDRVPAAVQDGIRRAKQELLGDHLDAVWMPYRYHFDEATGVCTFSMTRERMVRRAAGARWVGPVHEIIDVGDGPSATREDLFVEHRPPRPKDEVGRGRNLRILEKAVQGGDRTSRTLYYYANELRDHGRDEAALAAYREYLTLPAADWEKYQALVSMSQCAGRCGREDEAVGYLYDALRVDSSRSEAFLALGRRHFDREEWARAMTWYSAAAAATEPVIGFVSPGDYTWRPWDQLGVCLMNVGRHDEGIAASIRSLQEGNPDQERVRTNLHWSVEQVG